MDAARLQESLTRTKLIVGNIEETLQDFCQKYNPAPIAAIMMDLDYYSSTVHGLRVFDLPDSFILPRVFCYFDDILGSEVELLNNRTGMRLAMDEFNRDNPDKIISPAHYLLCKKVVEVSVHPPLPETLTLDGYWSRNQRKWETKRADFFGTDEAIS